MEMRVIADPKTGNARLDGIAAIFAVRCHTGMLDQECYGSDKKQVVKRY